MSKELFDKINPSKFSELLDEFNSQHEGQICDCCGEFYFYGEDPKIKKEGLCEVCFNSIRRD